MEFLNLQSLTLALLTHLDDRWMRSLICSWEAREGQPSMGRVEEEEARDLEALGQGEAEKCSAWWSSERMFCHSLAPTVRN
jgi:hypothetical protein